MVEDSFLYEIVSRSLEEDVQEDLEAVSVRLKCHRNTGIGIGFQNLTAISDKFFKFIYLYLCGIIFKVAVLRNWRQSSLIKLLESAVSMQNLIVCNEVLHI